MKAINFFMLSLLPAECDSVVRSREIICFCPALIEQPQLPQLLDTWNRQLKSYHNILLRKIWTTAGDQTFNAVRKVNKITNQFRNSI